MDVRIIFMGSPDFALPTLKALADKFNVVGVVTQPDQQAGRGRKLKSPPVKCLAKQLGLLVIQPDSLKDAGVVEQLEGLTPDVIVVAAFGQILRTPVLTMPEYGCVNVHASLLPRWRGAAPIQAAILNDEVSGVTIMQMDEGLDTGPILSQCSTPLSNEITGGELSSQLASLGAELLVETLPRYLQGEILPCSQNDDLATYAPRLKKADGKLDFNRSAAYLARQVRAYHPWPGAYQQFGDHYLKVIQAHPLATKEAFPGKRYVIDDMPAWGTSSGLLILDKVQLAGKTPVSGEDFLRGTRNWI